MYIAVIGAAAALLRSVFPAPEDHQREYKTWGGIDLFALFPHTHKVILFLYRTGKRW